MFRLISTGDLFKAKINATHHGIRRLPLHERSFTWSRTFQGWDYLAKLLDGLIESNCEGHQYLTRYPDEDAVVVVSKGEYSDSVMYL